MQRTPERNLKAELEALDARVNALLPPRYQHCYEAVSPRSMGSAKPKYGADGKIAWDQIWTTFCDLGLAGGPPHRGKLMEPVAATEVAANKAAYQEVVDELRRAIGLTTALPVLDGYTPGWIGVQCVSVAEAAWLQFAITAENVSARRRGAVLQLPAGPAFKPEKEIKNVVVSLFKSSHYWDSHLTTTQQGLAGVKIWEAAGPDEIAAAPAEYEAAWSELEEGLKGSGWPLAERKYPGWIGVETPSEEAAGWLLRAILVEQILTRREEHVVYVPVPDAPDSERAARVAWVLTRGRELYEASTRRTGWSNFRKDNG